MGRLFLLLVVTLSLLTCQVGSIRVHGDIKGYFFKRTYVFAYFYCFKKKF